MTIRPENLDSFVAPDLSDARLQSRRNYRMVIDGKSVTARSGETITRESPAHRGKIVGEWPAGSAADAELAIEAARRAFDVGPWPRMSGAERASILHSVGLGLLARVDELALIECLETGKPLPQARGEIAYCADLWIYAAGRARGLEGDTTMPSARIGWGWSCASLLALSASLHRGISHSSSPPSAHPGRSAPVAASSSSPAK